MIYTRTINDDGSITQSSKDNSTPPCEDFIEMIARKPKENQNQNQDIPALTPWEVNVGNRLSELGEVIVMSQKIKDEWCRELSALNNFIKYMNPVQLNKDDSKPYIPPPRIGR